MTSITSALPSYTPPAIAPVVSTSTPNPTPDATQNAPTDNDNNQPVAAAPSTPVTPTNADENTQATYTALANASTSNIRGTSVNTSA